MDYLLTLRVKLEAADDPEARTAAMEMLDAILLGPGNVMKRLRQLGVEVKLQRLAPGSPPKPVALLDAEED